LAKSYELESRPLSLSVLVVVPLQSIIEDQIAAMLDMQCTAMQLSPSTIEKILEDPPQFIFAAAEQVLEKQFLVSLKDTTSKLHYRLCGVIVDESHTIETWSGKR
jgi:superfamily II DNA helicase RecQ